MVGNSENLVHTAGYGSESQPVPISSMSRPILSFPQPGLASLAAVFPGSEDQGSQDTMCMLGLSQSPLTLSPAFLSLCPKQGR